jgi:hypothetical protein
MASASFATLEKSIEGLQNEFQHCFAESHSLLFSAENGR